MIDIDFIITLMKLYNESYIFCYCILNYIYNLIFDMNVSYMSFIIVYSQNLNHSSHVIYVTIFEAFKELYKVYFQILIYTSIYLFHYICVRLNNQRYTLCYCILNYDYNIIFDLNVSYMSFIIIFITNLEPVNSYNLCHNFRRCQRII